MAELGAAVTVVDLDRVKIDDLRRGRTPFFEPGLTELMTSNARTGRLRFTTSYAEALADVGYVMVCVPTPASPEGSLDSSFLRAAYDEILRYASQPGPIVINKSTVPVGTADKICREFDERSIQVVANPEFLSAGRAIDDFFHPARVIIGARNREVGEKVAALYEALHTRIVHTDPVTAELAKLAANAFLATKISFANVVAQISEHVGANAEELLFGLSLDPRIGEGHLRPGLGFGGSCLPKDLAAMEHLARTSQASHELFRAAADVNHRQRRRVIDILTSELGDIADRTIGILGVAFKPETDDVRESPGLSLARQLAELGARLRLYDPAAERPIASVDPSMSFADSSEAAADKADALVVATEWPQFREIDFAAALRSMRGTLLIDGRGLLDGDRMREIGFRFFSLAGRGSVARGAAQPVASPVRSWTEVTG
jgi:UDPglucose 6-dehydrogenase